MGAICELGMGMLNSNVKSVLVIGMGSSGVSAAELLLKLNKSVYIYDSHTADEISSIKNDMISKCTGVFFGIEPNELIDEKKIDLVVISPGVPLDIPLVKRIKSNGIGIIGELELGYALATGRFLVITGTNGKTTTTALVGKICECAKIEYDVVGNIGKPVTQGVLEDIKSGVNNPDKTWVTEVSSFQLETADAFRPTVSAILNITPDHLNRHKTMDSYIRAKKRVYENQQNTDTLVLNAGDEILSNIEKEWEDTSYNKNENPRILYFGKEICSDRCVYLKNDTIMIRDKQNDMQSCAKIEDIEIVKTNELNIIGEHNIENAMAATAICYSAGISVEAIKQGLKEFEAVDHRLQKIAEFNGVQFYNDSKATNPDAAIKALQAMTAPVVLIAGGMDKKNDFTEFLQWVDKKAKNMIVFGETSPILKDTADKCGYNGIVLVEDMKSAVKKAFECSKSGDIVLLSPACASWDMYKNYQVRGEDFKNCVFEIGGGK